jgi:TonB family protein
VDQAAPITPESEAAAGEAELGADDLAMIDEEVRKRLDEERRRLEAQNQPAPATPSSTAASPGPQSEPRVVEQAPAPKVEEPSATEPATQPPVEQVADKVAPPPAVAAPAPEPKKPTVREGDLVQPGTPGLIDPELISMKKVGYPPIAQRQRVEGIVIVRALVSETGRVIEAEVLRGVPQNVGINEAAREMVMGSTFKPATKDGVKVKAYKTVPIPFKL